MYRAYKRTGIASYVRYTYFKVAVRFSEGGIPKTYSFAILEDPVCLYPFRFFGPYRGKNH